MRLLTATTRAQGDRGNDHCSTVEGELVGVAPLAGDVGELLEVAASWPAGTVLERRLDLIRVRSAFT